MTFDADGGSWLWISPEDLAEFVCEIGVLASQPERWEEDLDMERIIKVFGRYGMRFFEGDQ